MLVLPVMRAVRVHARSDVGLASPLLLIALNQSDQGTRHLK
jgi:hypothetical protein